MLPSKRALIGSNFAETRRRHPASLTRDVSRFVRCKAVLLMSRRSQGDERARIGT